MKIQVEGRQIQLLRYMITYNNEDMIHTEYVRTQAEAEQIAQQYYGSIETLDTEADEWIDGIEFPETNRPMEKALEIVAMGEEGYKKWLQQQAAQSPENLAAENAQLKQQLTDTQLALVEVYEMMLPS